MRHTANNDWQRVNEGGSTFMLRLIRWCALHVSEHIARASLYPITAYYLLRRHAERRASRHYLQRVLGHQPGLQHIARHIHTFAVTILDRVFLLTNRFASERVRVHGVEILQAHLQAGRGVLLLGSHFGSFEAVRAVGLPHNHVNLRIVMDYGHNAQITEVLDALNPRARASIIDAGTLSGPSVMLEINAVLAQGGLVGILADRVRNNEPSLPATLLGGRVHLPSSPYRMAATLRCPVMLIFGILRADNTYDVYFEPFAEQIELGARSQRSAKLQLWTQRYAERLEHYIKAAPYNWFNFYEFWPSALSEPAEHDSRSAHHPL